MEQLTCRFRAGRAFAEGALVLAAPFLLYAAFFEAVDPQVLMVVLTVAANAALALLNWARWRSRLVVHDRGVEVRRSDRVLAKLDWEEIDELFLLDDTQFEVRGAGRHIRFAGPYDDLYSAREACLPRLERIRATLQERAIRDGAVVFRMPGGRWKAHLAYFLAILVLSGVTWYCLATLLDRKFRTSVPFLLLFFGGSWLWKLRRQASGLGTRVIVEREGIVVRRLDGKDKIAWKDLDRTEWNDENGINLVLRSRRVIALPSTLANIGLLEEFLDEGRRGADSGPQEESEGRTMIQSS